MAAPGRLDVVPEHVLLVGFGLGSLTVGVWQVPPPSALIALGVLCIVAGLAARR